jgi:hypothetical protein
MKIENKEIYRLYGNIKHYDKAVYHGTCGLFIEGFNGGVTVYATDGKAVYRKTFTGDNKTFFSAYWNDWKRKGGLTDTQEFKHGKNGDFNNFVIPKIKEYFARERFNKITVDGKAFKKAVKGVDAINRGEIKHNVVLSFHGKNLDIASWTDNEESASWQLDGDFIGDGAVMADRKYLDFIKSDSLLEMSFLKMADTTALYFKSGDIDAVIMPKLKINEKMFFETLGYEYKQPEKTETAIIEPEKIIKVKPKKEKREPRKPFVSTFRRAKKPNGAFTGWTFNRLGTKQVKICNW